MIYIVRHGETDWNKEGRRAGHLDVELNEIGINQAMNIKEKLTQIKFDKVFSSPLKRASKTAEIIFDGEIIKDERLRERSNGELDGKLKTECNVDIDFNDPNEKRFGIEPLLDFKTRIYDFLDDVVNKYQNKNILIVTHAGVAIYMRCYFEGEPKDGNYQNYKLKNCDILLYNNEE